MRLTIALCSLAAAAIHFIVVQEHLEEWWGYGWFFLGLGAYQGLYAVGLTALKPRGYFGYAFSGMVVNLLAIALYIITRTSGIPLFGPAAGEVEPVGFLDLTSTVLEFLLVVLLVGSLPPRPERGHD